MHQRYSAPVLIRGGTAQTLRRVKIGDTAFAGVQENEAWLQALIHRHPSCLPLHEIAPGSTPWEAICREMPTPAGPIDHLLMTGRGEIALIETKLFRNPEARREALAQALDYAGTVFGRSYKDFERMALDGQISGKRPKSLYDALRSPDLLPEPEFVDAVSANLSSGDITIVIAGDGIRSEAERLLSSIQAYAQFRFRLALAEIAVYRVEETNELLVAPRLLARTTTVERPVFVMREVTDGETLREANRSLMATPLDREGAYWARLEQSAPGLRAPLTRLIEAARPLGVQPEFLGSLNLKWPGLGEKPLNLGYVWANGRLWLDAASWFAPRDLAKAYVEDLAQLFRADVHLMGKGQNPTLFRNGQSLRVAEIIDLLPQWPPVMAKFISAIQERRRAQHTMDEA
jgi:hypothetical protein